MRCAPFPVGLAIAELLICRILYILRTSLRTSLLQNQPQMPENPPKSMHLFEHAYQHALSIVPSAQSKISIRTADIKGENATLTIHHVRLSLEDFAKTFAAGTVKFGGRGPLPFGDLQMWKICQTTVGWAATWLMLERQSLKRVAPNGGDRGTEYNDGGSTARARSQLRATPCAMSVASASACKCTVSVQNTCQCTDHNDSRSR